MIRYPFNLLALEAEINRRQPTWMRRAARRTARLVRAGTYNEKTSIWGEIKPTFVELQHRKCIFCECKLEFQDDRQVKTTLEHDLEHFRPKNSVQSWPDPVIHSHLSHPGIGGTYPVGYYWLAYELTNYAAACKTCNSSFKHRYFPVAGTRPTPPASVASTVLPVALNLSEKPFLCYPLGTIDDDPEDLITFVATTAIPVHSLGFERARAEVIIDFFGLNARDHLHMERAKMISIFGAAFENQARGFASPADLHLIASIGQPQHPHSSCLKAFAKSWTTDIAFARRTLDACKSYVIGQ